MTDTQLIVCGFPRSGSTLLYAMMRASGRGVAFTEREESAKSSLGRPGCIVTKRPKDVFHLDMLLAANRLGKTVKIVLTVRDPRAVLASVRSSWGTQPFIGGDQCLAVSPEGASFTDPGLLAFWDAVLAARARTDVAVEIVRFEDLVRDPEAVRRRLADFTGIAFATPFSAFHEVEVPELLQGPLNGVRPVDATRLAPWTEGSAARRVARQFRLRPRLFEIVETLGYETDRTWFEDLVRRMPEGLDDRPGTVVAYHTADPVYSGEAARLRTSLDRLGLPYEITEVTSGTDWLATVRMKPGFLLDRRRTLRGPLLYVDVDAVLHSDPWPDLNGYEADVAFCVLRDGKGRSGTILLADTPGALRFLADWTDRLAAAPDAWDQHPFNDIVRDVRHGRTLPYVVQLLPPSMCAIFDFYRYTPTDLPAAWVIEHLQASREGRTADENALIALQRRRDRIAAIEQDLLGDDRSASAVATP